MEERPVTESPADAVAEHELGRSFWGALYEHEEPLPCSWRLTQLRQRRELSSRKIRNAITQDVHLGVIYCSKKAESRAMPSSTRSAQGIPGSSSDATQRDPDTRPRVDGAGRRGVCTRPGPEHPGLYDCPLPVHVPTATSTGREWPGGGQGRRGPVEVTRCAGVCGVQGGCMHDSRHARNG